MNVGADPGCPENGQTALVLIQYQDTIVHCLDGHRLGKGAGIFSQRTESTDKLHILIKLINFPLAIV